MSVTVEPLVFECAGQQLVGALHRPAEEASTGILVVVGGPQYRVGAHRQFVLLSRELAAHGYPVFRFDHRGIGDSDGEYPGFEHIGPDIAAAIDEFQRRCPGIRRFVIWGLCDAASAALFHGWQDARVAGLILLNPWVRTDQTLARAYLSDYYGSRLLQPDFWRKLLTGRVAVFASIRDFAAKLRGGLRRGGQSADALSLPDRMMQGLQRFSGPVLIILSGNDLTAGEFRACARADEWQQALAKPAVSVESLENADHTFSTRAWRDDVARRCVAWLAEL